VQFISLINSNYYKVINNKLNYFLGSYNKFDQHLLALSFQIYYSINDCEILPINSCLGVLNERSASRASSGSARISSTRILNEAFHEHLFLARIINEASSARLD
jgi:hypothetical protein